MSKDYDPVRVAAPDGLVQGVEGVTGRRYDATGGGMYEMHPRDAAALVKAGGFIPSITGKHGFRGGYTCTGCGFKAVVRTCSRCGGECLKSGETLPEIDLGLSFSITKSHRDAEGVLVIDEVTV